MWQREKRRILLIPRILVRLQPSATVGAQPRQVGCQPRPPLNVQESASPNYPSTGTKRSLSADVCSHYALLLPSSLPLGLGRVRPHDALGLQTQWPHSCVAHCNPQKAARPLVPIPTHFPAQLCLRQFSTSVADEAGPYVFKTLGVSPELEERLKDLDIARALPIQAAAVPAILAGCNAAIKSCTGSGKTLTYVLPAIQLGLSRRRAAEEAYGASRAVDAGSGDDVQAGFRRAALKHRTRCLQALIVAPSRELCIQIQRTAQEVLPSSVDRRHIVQLIGGANRTRQEAALAGRDGGVWPLVAVGTPGRVAEFVVSGKLPVWNCPMLVLDEVDQLLEQHDMRKHIDDICDHVGRRANTSIPLAGTASTFTTNIPPPAIGPSTRPALRAGIPTADCGASGSGSGRQTVIVSASLDARDPDRFSNWCRNPVWIVLGSCQALPPEFLQLPNSVKASQEPPKPESSQWAAREAGELVLEGAVRDAQNRGQEGANKGGGTRQEGRAYNVDGDDGGGSPKETVEAATLDGATHRPSKPEAEDTEDAGPLVGVLPPHLAHVYTLTPAEHRTDRVRRLIHALGAERALLFVPKQNQAMVTKYKLEARNMQVTILHGRLSKMERGNILDAFRRGVFRALVVTDLGARGLDLPDCDAVINFGPPTDALSYAHRAGRTGRAGAAGVVATVVTQKEMKLLSTITKRLGLNLQGIALSEGNIAPLEEPLKKPSLAHDVPT